MKFVLIGTQGGHYIDAIRAAKEDPNIVFAGVAPAENEDISMMRFAMERSGVYAPLFDNWEKMVEEVKPDIAIVSPKHYLAARISAKCLRMGMHVYGEKPCATTLEDLDMLEAAWRESGKKYASMLTYYYEVPFFKAACLLEEGAIGDIRLISAQKSYKFGSRRPDFYRVFDEYGGTIPWVGIHAISWIHWFTKKKFLSVYAQQSTLANRGYGELDMTDVCSFSLEDEILANVNIDYLNPDSNTVHGDDRIRLAGTKGTLEIIHGQVILINENHCGPVSLEDEVPVNIFADFVRSIEGSPARFDAEDSFAITRAALCAQKAAREHRILSI